MLLRARNRAACWATATAAAPFECCKLLAEDRELPLLLLHGGGQQLVLPLAPVELGLHLLQLRRGVTCCCAPPLRLLHRPCCRQRLQLSSCHGYMARGHATGAHSSRLAEPHTMLLRWRILLLSARGQRWRLECLSSTITSTAIPIYLLQWCSADLLLKMVLLGAKPGAGLLPRHWRLHRAGRLGASLVGRGRLCGLHTCIGHEKDSAKASEHHTAKTELSTNSRQTCAAPPAGPQPRKIRDQNRRPSPWVGDTQREARQVQVLSVERKGVAGAPASV